MASFKRRVLALSGRRLTAFLVPKLRNVFMNFMNFNNSRNKESLIVCFLFVPCLLSVYMDLPQFSIDENNRSLTMWDINWILLRPGLQGS